MTPPRHQQTDATPSSPKPALSTTPSPLPVSSPASPTLVQELLAIGSGVIDVGLA
jgi:hypothetical protein